MMRSGRGRMRHLGRLTGSGTLSCEDVVLGVADFEIDGYCLKPDEVVGSGEIRMAPADLDRAIGRRNLRLATADGQVLELRISGRRQDAMAGVAHADVTSGLPPPEAWRR
jgi:hypothetical protein